MAGQEGSYGNRISANDAVFFAGWVRNGLMSYKLEILNKYINW